MSRFADKISKLKAYKNAAKQEQTAREIKYNPFKYHGMSIKMIQHVNEAVKQYIE